MPFTLDLFVSVVSIFPHECPEPGYENFGIFPIPPLRELGGAIAM